jgi:Fe-S-cluster containining protein
MPATVDLPGVASAAATAAMNEMLEALRGPPVGPRGWPAELATQQARWEASAPHLDLAFAAYDRFLSAVARAHPVSCGAACTACCHDNPRGVTGVELRRLRDVIAGWPDRDAVVAQFRRYAAAGTPPEQWRRLRRPCPLLDTAGRCRAYEARPIACRAFVAHTPAGWCDPDHARHADRVNPHLDPHPVILRLLDLLSQALELGKATDLHAGLAR